MPMYGVSHLHDALYHSAASLLPEQVQQPNLESRGPKDLQVLLWLRVVGKAAHSHGSGHAHAGSLLQREHSYSPNCPAHTAHGPCLWRGLHGEE